MIPKQMLRRLTTLEAEVRAAQPPTEPDAELVLWHTLVAYHVGRWQPHKYEFVFEAFARALGYTYREFLNEIYGDPDTLNAREQSFKPRFRSAIATMFELEKVDVKKAPRNVVAEALGRLIDAAEKGGIQLGERPPLAQMVRNKWRLLTRGEPRDSTKPLPKVRTLPGDRRRKA
jgi:hypothetical protein